MSKYVRQIRLSWVIEKFFIEQTPIVNPFSATEAILKESEIATTLIAQARLLNKGKPCKQVKVGFHRQDKALQSNLAGWQTNLTI